MSGIVYLIMYLVTAVGAYYRSVSRTGRTSTFGLLMSAFGYLLVCGFFHFRDHLDPRVSVGMLIPLLGAGVLVFFIKSQLGTEDRQEAYDAYVKEQEEIANSKYSTLDPDSSWTAPDRTAWLDQNRPQKLNFLPLILVLIVVGVLDVVFYYYIQTVLPHQTDAAITKAPLVAPQDLAQAADKFKLVKCELWTGKGAAGLPDGIAYERLYRRDTEEYDSSLHWIDANQEPASLSLVSADKKTKIFVSGNDIDRMFLKVYFDDLGSKRKEAPVPRSWLKAMDRDGDKYLVKGIPANKRVTCVGIIETFQKNLWLRPFAYKDYEHGAIVTEIPTEELDQYLTKHPSFGPQIGALRKSAGVDSRYETDVNDSNSHH